MPSSSQYVQGNAPFSFAGSNSKCLVVVAETTKFNDEVLVLNKYPSIESVGGDRLMQRLYPLRIFAACFRGTSSS